MYLGLTILSGTRFRVSFDYAKCKFYSAFNPLYSELVCIPDLNVTLHLLDSIALPDVVIRYRGSRSKQVYFE